MQHCYVLTIESATVQYQSLIAASVEYEPKLGFGLGLARVWLGSDSSLAQRTQARSWFLARSQHLNENISENLPLLARPITNCSYIMLELVIVNHKKSIFKL